MDFSKKFSVLHLHWCGKLSADHGWSYSQRLISETRFLILREHSYSQRDLLCLCHISLRIGAKPRDSVRIGNHLSLFLCFISLPLKPKSSISAKVLWVSRVVKESNLVSNQILHLVKPCFWWVKYCDIAVFIPKPKSSVSARSAFRNQVGQGIQFGFKSNSALG